MNTAAGNTSTAAPADNAVAAPRPVEHPTETTPLTFKKQPVKGLGVYWGHSDDHAYRIMRDEKRKGGYHWLLDARTLIETAGVKHSLGQPIIAQTLCDSFAEAKRVAAKAVELLSRHPSWDVRQALTKGHTAVIDEDIAEIRASREYQRAIAAADRKNQR